MNLNQNLVKKGSVRTIKVVKAVRERIRRNPAQSGRKMAKDMEISKTTMQRLLKDDLGLTAYKKQKVHGLTEVQKKAKITKSKFLLQWHDGDDIIFFDKKLFLAR